MEKKGGYLATLWIVNELEKYGEVFKKEEVTLQLCECPGLEKFQNFAINLMPDAQ